MMMPTFSLVTWPASLPPSHLSPLPELSSRKSNLMCHSPMQSAQWAPVWISPNSIVAIQGPLPGAVTATCAYSHISPPPLETLLHINPSLVLPPGAKPFTTLCFSNNTPLPIIRTPLATQQSSAPMCFSKIDLKRLLSRTYSSSFCF